MFAKKNLLRNEPAILCPYCAKPIAKKRQPALILPFPFFIPGGSVTVTPSSQNYTTPGTYTYTVPTYNTLTVYANGAGSGGCGAAALWNQTQGTGCCQTNTAHHDNGTAGTVGTKSVFNSGSSYAVTGNPGGLGTVGTWSSQQVSYSCGTTSTVYSTASGASGSSAGGSGPGTTNTGSGGAGGSGGFWQQYSSCNCNGTTSYSQQNNGGGGGAGGQQKAVFTAGAANAPAVGASVTVIVGTGGSAGTIGSSSTPINNYSSTSGGSMTEPTAGANGSVLISVA